MKKWLWRFKRWEDVKVRDVEEILALMRRVQEAVRVEDFKGLKRRAGCRKIFRNLIEVVKVKFAPKWELKVLQEATMMEAVFLRIERRIEKEERELERLIQREKEGHDMALVRASQCKTCKQAQGERHKIITPIPDREVREHWLDTGVAKATDGCPVPTDGICQHGHYSWLVTLRVVPVNPKQKPKKFVPSPASGRVGTENSGQEETDMRKSKKGSRGEGRRTRAPRVAGKYRAQSAVALLFLLLADGKAHSKKEMQKVVGKSAPAVRYGRRLRRLIKDGKKTGAWKVTVDEETGAVRMKVLKKDVLKAAPVEERETEKPSRKEPKEKASGKKKSRAERRAERKARREKKHKGKDREESTGRRFQEEDEVEVSEDD